MDELQKQLAASLAELEKHRARADAAEKAFGQADDKVKTLEASIGKIEAARDNAVAEAGREKSRADAAESKAQADVVQARKDADDSLANRVRERVSLETNANKVLGAFDKDNKSIDRSEMTDRAIKAEIVKRVDGMDVPESKPETYLDGMYEGALSRHAAAGESRDEVRATINQNRRNDAVDKAPSGRAAELAAYEQLARDTVEGYLHTDSDDEDGEE